MIEGKIHREMSNLYVQGRRGFAPGAWKIENDSVITSDVVSSIIQDLVSEGVISRLSDHFVFLSPTANIPTHEITCFEYITQTLKVPSTFIAGDICEYPLNTDHIYRENEGSSFQYVRLDAQQLPIRDSSVDLIWDRKGWLWHVSRSYDQEQILNALMEYYRVLRPGGAIVIDDIIHFEEKVRKLYSSYPFTKLVGMLIKAIGARYVVFKPLNPSDIAPVDLLGQTEPSTYDTVVDAFGSEQNWLNQLYGYYEQTRVGRYYTRVAVLKKHEA